jgi:hypothetical protein
VPDVTDDPPPPPPPPRDEPDEPPAAHVTLRDDNEPAGEDRPPRRYDDLPPRPFGRLRRRPSWEEDEDYPRNQGGTPEDLPDVDYRVSIGRWLSLARQHYGAYFGQAIGYAIVAGLISGAAQAVVGAIAGFILDPPLQAGPTVVALAQMKGQRWKFGDFFGGFQVFGQTIGLRFMQGFATLGVMAPGLIVGLFALFMDDRGALVGEPGKSVWGVAVFAGCCLLSLLAAWYVGMRLSFFALHLVIDRRFNVMDALTTSWRLCRGRVGGLILFSLTLGAINFGPCVLVFAALAVAAVAVLGPPGGPPPPGGLPVELVLVGAYLVAWLPMLFTAPFTSLAQTAAYLDAAGTVLPVTREEADRRREGEDEDY